jgi:hypothetical protein
VLRELVLRPDTALDPEVSQMNVGTRAFLPLNRN